MTDALKDHKVTVGFEERPITNLHFAGDVGGLAGKEEELESRI